jgi:hypothetical protein
MRFASQAINSLTKLHFVNHIALIINDLYWF